ncbi:MAG: hypothetical protein WCD18_11845, partial [Thermosynechococcaceae cyanobacterium]
GWPASLCIAVPFMMVTLAAQLLIQVFPILIVPYITVGGFAFGFAILLFFYFFPNQWVRTPGILPALGGSIVYFLMVALAVAFQQALVVIIASFFAVFFLQRRYD